jgi:hypothetical protein
MESHNPFMFQTTNQIFYDYPMKNEGFMVVSWYANRKSMAQNPLVSSNVDGKSSTDFLRG